MSYLAGFTSRNTHRRRIVTVDVLVFINPGFGNSYRWCTLSCGHRTTVAAWRPYETAECREHRCKQPHEDAAAEERSA